MPFLLGQKPWRFCMADMFAPYTKCMGRGVIPNKWRHLPCLINYTTMIVHIHIYIYTYIYTHIYIYIYIYNYNHDNLLHLHDVECYTQFKMSINFPAPPRGPPGASHRCSPRCSSVPTGPPNATSPAIPSRWTRRT